MTQARRGAIFGAYLKITPVFIFLVPGMIAFALAEKGMLDLTGGHALSFQAVTRGRRNRLRNRGQVTSCRDAVFDVFKLSVEEGIRFVDTAEVYGNGMSERLLGRFLKKTEQPVLIATKYMPFPWRILRSSIWHALKNSLERIGVDSVDLYQIHWPTPLQSVDHMMGGMTECVKSGMTRTVGVSNFNQTQMLTAYSALARQNIPLAANQVHYSLLNRKVEKNGLLARCRELGVRLIAYSPLEKGMLTGKYDVNNRPPGTRAGRYASLLPKIEPLIKLMTTIGQDHGGKSKAQVALNWTICKGTLPIPGAKNIKRAQENTGALGWKLTEDEVMKLDELSDQISDN